MATDLTKTTYKYTVNSDGTVNFTADADNVTQKLAGELVAAALTSQDSLTAYLNDYCTAYVAGLAVEQPQIGEGITVGQSQSGNAPAPSGDQGA